MYEIKVTCLYCGAIETKTTDTDEQAILNAATDFAKGFGADHAHSKAGGFSFAWAPKSELPHFVETA